MELSTMEIAARCNKSERTIQRWIQNGTLSAEQIEGNRYEVNEGDLQPFLPRPVLDSLTARIDTLERRVASLEDIIRESGTQRPSRSLQSQKHPSENDPLPAGLVPINDLIKQFNLPRSTTLRNMAPYIIKGDWKAGGSVVHHALDETGQAEFMRRYRQ